MGFQSEQDRIRHIFRRFRARRHWVELECYLKPAEGSVDLLLEQVKVSGRELPPAEAFGCKQGLKIRNIREW